jgi:NAD(P)-dependent dehydrogenase (short-subunit alcohol dehydrogenase family)
MRIEGMTAVVTGGASGLGGATSALLAKRGARVTIFDLNEELGHSHAAAIGGRFEKVDVADEESVTAGLDAAESANGVARILVNCAGIAMGGKTVGRDGAAHPLDLFQRTIAVNLTGTFNTMSKFAARLTKAEPLGEERGVVINTASTAAFEGQVGQAAYSASKAGVVGLMVPAARDLAQHGIRVMTIAPGLFLTPMVRGLPQPVQDSLGRQAPFPNRLGDPVEFASLVEQIVENPMLNGEVIRLDACLRLPPR